MNDKNQNLRMIADALPDGAITEIAKRTGYSQSYVSHFFAGKYNLSNRNMCVLDEADKILEEEKAFDQRAQTKLNTLLSKTRE
jgi:transcriptional regulator with XRE-family HTH domain